MRPDVDWKDQSTATRYRRQNREQMADFLSLYLMDPARAESMAPELTAALREKIAANPTVAEAVDLVVSPPTIKAKPAPREERVTEPPARPPGAKIEADPELKEAGYIAGNKALRTREAQLSRTRQTARKLRKITTRKERRDLVFYMEKTGDPEIENDTFAALKARTSPKLKKVARDLAYQWELNRQEANKLFKEAGESAEYLKYLDDYVAHMWEVSRKKSAAFLTKWRKKTPHAAQRKIPTYAEGIEMGLVPKTLDAVYLYELSADNNFTAAVTRQFAKDIKNMKTSTGQPATSPTMVEGWTKIDHPVLRRTYARRTKGGDLILGEGHMWVHPWLTRPVEVLLQRPYTGALAKGLYAVNSSAKSMNVSFSFFHEIALYESSTATLAKALNPLRGIFIGPFEAKRLGKGFRFIRTYKAGHQVEADAIDAAGISDAAQHGLSMGRSASADYARGFVSKALRNAETAAKDVPVGRGLLRNIRKGYDAYQRHLWDNTHVGFKLLAYHRLVADNLPNLPAGVSVKEAKETIASFVNDAFGGQEHLRLPAIQGGKLVWAEPATIRMQQILHAVMFAPDWTISNIRVAARTARSLLPGGNPIYRRIGLRYWRNMGIQLAAVAIIFQKMLHLMFGDDDEDLAEWSWQNEKGHKWDVDVTPITRAIQKKLGMEVQEHRSYIHAGKQAREVVRYFDDFPDGLMRNMGSKSSVAVKLIMQQFTGHEPGSEFPAPWTETSYREKLKGWEQLIARGKAAGEKFRPFSWSPTNFAFALPKSKGMTRYKAGKYFRDAQERWADPSWWENNVTGKRDPEKERKAVLDLLREIDDAARKNGLSEKERKRIFSEANTSLRDYYGLWDALDKEQFDKARRIATIILNCGGTKKTVRKSGKSRELDKETIRAGVEAMGQDHRDPIKYGDWED
jgi:hypothetical protein